jgi:curved DNA-binding protein CbpA
MGSFTSDKSFFCRTGSTLSTGAVTFSLYFCTRSPQQIRGGNFERRRGNPAARAMMKTLYDLLGALPSDDAEGLRTAFRTAVKGAHPDIHPGDPDAALKFRQIVRANEILIDDEQRTAYDHLLELARLEQESASQHVIAARIYRFASGVIALAGASVVTVGGYLLFMHLSAAAVAPANSVDVTARASAEIAPLSPAASPAAISYSALPAKPEAASRSSRVIVASAAMPQSNAENLPAADVGLAPDPTAVDARFLRAQGVFAYRNGDLSGAIANLDQAIDLDPKFSAAYIDRGIILYRLRKFDRAFADIARARQIEKTSRAKPAPTAAKKQRLDQVAIAPPARPVLPPQAPPPDPSRGEGFTSAMR